MTLRAVGCGGRPRKPFTQQDDYRKSLRQLNGVRIAWGVGETYDNDQASRTDTKQAEDWQWSMQIER